jgi:uncharacterized membrane protein
MAKRKNKSRNGDLKKAELRKQLERNKKKKDDMMFFGIVGIIIIAILAGYYYFAYIAEGNDLGPEPAEDIVPSAGSDVISIPVSKVDDGDAHYYSYNSNGVKIRYFVLKSSDGVIRAAFDTCDVCYDAKLGYHQEDDEMVCNNCGQRFPSEKINVEKGGCNPAPLKRSVVGSNLEIKIDDIEDGRWYFA